MLANVAQIRPEHDERFLRHCAASFCIFCECAVDSSTKVDLSLAYLAQSWDQSRSAQHLQRLTTQTDSIRSTTIGQATLTSTNGAETTSTQWSTSTMPISEATTTFQNEEATYLRIMETSTPKRPTFTKSL